MFKHPVFLTLAVMACGAPATIAAVVLLPWSVTIGVTGISEQPKLAVLNLMLVAAAAYSLGSYWLLAARTIKGLPFTRGWTFWSSCVAALFCIAAVIDAFPPIAALLVAGPIVMATAFCLYSQRTVGRQNAA